LPTMMRYVFCVLAIAAAVAFARTLTQQEKDTLLAYHNLVRDKVMEDYPDLAPAQCLPHLEWDDWLAEHAQNYSNTCPSDHSHHSYKNGQSMGENLAWSPSSISFFTDALYVAVFGLTRYCQGNETQCGGWYNESKQYNFEAVGDCPYMVGHYTAMVWASTQYVGCGWADNCSVTIGGSTYQNTVTCNYYPAGNIVGRKPWTPRDSGVPLPVCPEPGSSGSTPASSTSPHQSSSTPVTVQCTKGDCCDTTTGLFRPQTYECSPLSGCVAAKFCTGNSADCPTTDRAATRGTVCNMSSGVCENNATCDGRTTTCPAKTYKNRRTICRDKVADCDVAEYCTGNSAECPEDNPGSCSSSVVTPSSSTPVTVQCTKGDCCDTTTGLFRPQTYECSPLSGCVAAKFCTGNSADCPTTDRAATRGTVCNMSSGVCENNATCDGRTTTCPAKTYKNRRTICRDKVADCDVAEYCTGNSAECPEDNPGSCSSSVVTPSSSTPVTPSSSTPATTSSGSTQCTSGFCCDPRTHTFRPTSFECRPKHGPCDVAEFCSGTSADCPEDIFIEKGTVCNKSNGCETDGVCTGLSGECSAKEIREAGFVCRPAAGSCDVEEKCDGVSGSCPADKYRPSGESCGDGDVCGGDTPYCAGEQPMDSAPKSGGFFIPVLLAVLVFML